MKRIFLFVVTNVAILVVLSIAVHSDARRRIDMDERSSWRDIP